MNDVPFGFSMPPEDPDERREATGGPTGSADSGSGGSSGSGPGGSGSGGSSGSGPGGSGSGGSGGSGSGGSGGPPQPFGFGSDPFSAMFGGQMDPAAMGAAFQKLGQLMAWQGGPVNWDLARDVARQAVSAGKDKSVSRVERDEVADAVRLAEVWLDEATSLPAGTTSAIAWSRAEWVEGTLPQWKQLVEPVAAKVGEALAGTMSRSLPEELGAQIQALAGPMQQMMTSMGGAMFGAQVGQALGTLAGEVLGSMDIGLPLGPANRAVLLPANLAEFGEGLDVGDDQVRLYLALREAAHHRLYGHVPWLRSRVVAAVEDYARGITIDASQLEQAMGSIDPANPESLQEALAGNLFEPQTTPAQQAALQRLETLLALVEGWVDEVVDAAATPRLPAAGALHETLRRRRATGGPAEQTFASLVGLELRPRRLREAATLWKQLREERGIEGRDAVWGHPDLMPSADDLDSPESYVAGGLPISDFDISSLELPREGTSPEEEPVRRADEDETRNPGTDES